MTELVAPGCSRGQGIHHLIETEAGWFLARRELLEAAEPLPDKNLGGRKQIDPVDTPM
jgi:hypothetical protein